MPSTLPLYPAMIDPLRKAGRGKRNPAPPPPKKNAKPKVTAALPTVNLTATDPQSDQLFQFLNQIQAGMGKAPVNPADIPMGLSGPTLRDQAGKAQVEAGKAIPPQLEREMVQLKARLKELEGVRQQLELTPPTAEEPYHLPASPQRPELPYPDRPQAQVNPMAGVLATLAGFADPQMAGQYAATVQQSAQQAADKGFQDRIAQFQNDLEQKTRQFEDETARRTERIRMELANRELMRENRKVKTEYERMKGELDAKAQAVQAELEGTGDFSTKLQRATALQAEADRSGDVVKRFDAAYSAKLAAREEKEKLLIQNLTPQYGQNIRQKQDIESKATAREDTQQHQLTMQKNALQAAMARQQATISGANYRAGLAAQKKVKDGKTISPGEMQALLIEQRMAENDLTQIKRDRLKIKTEAGNNWTPAMDSEWKVLEDAAQLRVDEAKAARKNARGQMSVPAANKKPSTMFQGGMNGVQFIIREK